MRWLVLYIGSHWTIRGYVYSTVKITCTYYFLFVEVYRNYRLLFLICVDWFYILDRTERLLAMFILPWRSRVIIMLCVITVVYSHSVFKLSEGYHRQLLLRKTYVTLDKHYFTPGVRSSLALRAASFFAFERWALHVKSHHSRKLCKEIIAFVLL